MKSKRILKSKKSLNTLESFELNEEKNIYI